MYRSDQWNSILYYTMGFLPSLFFTLRFLILWISSEKRREMHVGKNFWYLSICGNSLLAAYYFIQHQYILLCIQTINGFISWRNLTFYSPRTQRVYGLARPLLTLFLLLLLASLLFWGYSFFLSPLSEGIGIFSLSPARGGSSSQISLGWHLFGGISCLVFASRFWWQWIEVEKTGVSNLPENFWILSICGSSAAILYFLHIRDIASVLHYSFGLIPYMRNLFFSKKMKAHKHQE